MSNLIDYIKFFVPLIAFFCYIVAAIEFSSIAEEKGYKGYFWFCLLIPIIGYLMVIALPDKKKMERENYLGYHAKPAAIPSADTVSAAADILE